MSHVISGNICDSNKLNPKGAWKVFFRSARCCCWVGFFFSEGDQKNTKSFFFCLCFKRKEFVCDENLKLFFYSCAGYDLKREILLVIILFVQGYLKKHNLFFSILKRLYFLRILNHYNKSILMSEAALWFFDNLLCNAMQT